jgi:hypothetical protein
MGLVNKDHSKFYGFNGWSCYDKVNLRFKLELQESKLSRQGFSQKNFYQGNLLDIFPASRTAEPKRYRGEEEKIF